MSREVAVLAAARRLGWLRVDTRSTRIGLLAASVAVILEAAHRLLHWPGPIVIGGLPVSPSSVPLGLAGLAGGVMWFGRPRSHDAAKAFWILTVLGLAVGMATLASTRSPLTITSLVISGFVEELLYRGALPALVAFVLARAGVRPRTAGLAGMITGGVAFVALPGHVAQWHSPLHVLPFVAFAIIAGIGVWRTGALLEMGLLHGVINILNVGRIDNGGDPVAGILLAGLTLLFVLSYVPPRRHGVVIDLTENEPSVSLTRRDRPFETGPLLRRGSAAHPDRPRDRAS